MGDFTSAEYADIIYVYGVCDGNGLHASREYQRRFPNRRQPSVKLFARTFQRLRETGTTAIKNYGGVHPNANNVDNEINIIDAVLDNPRISTRRIAAQLNLSQSMISRTLRREQLFPYHFQRVQSLLPRDYGHRMEFCRWLLYQHNEIPDFVSNVLWSDEAHFTRDGINTIHNSHLWSIDNPHAIIETRYQHRFSVNVWAGILRGGLLEIHILNQRLNAQLYEHFLNDRLYEIIGDIPLDIRLRMWYQHDGAPCHNGRNVIMWLNTHYPGRWIGRGGPVNWPARSPDLNPLDFYLWGHMKQLVYSVEIDTREQLLERILNAAIEIRNNGQVARVYDSLIRRAHACIRAQGAQFEQFLA